MARKIAAKAGEKASAAMRPAADPLAAEAENYDRVRAALETDAASVSPLWISLLTFGTYLAISIGAVTHRQLFLEDPVKLPVLNVDLPVVGFFTLAPILYLVFHAYLLLNLALMAEDVHRYDEFLKGRQLNPLAEQHLRQQLPNSLFLRLLAGLRRPRASMIDWLLIIIAWLTVVIGPVLLLVFAQLQFLPFHSWFASWMERGVTVVDIGLLWWFWPLILRGVSVRGWLKATVQVVAGALSLCIVVFSVFLATYPGGDLYRFWIAEPVTVLLFEGAPDGVTGRPTSWFSNRLVLPDQDFVDDDALQKMIARHPFSIPPWGGERTRSLRGRDLRGAVLIRVDLRRADFTGARLEGADLSEANLTGALFGCAGETAADDGLGGEPATDCAQLQGASLNLARLQGASLNGAQLQGASFVYAGLQGASLRGAQLQGASLITARLQGASLHGAWLQGAWLLAAQLQGALLTGAQLQGASLDLAHLQGASLDLAQLQGASLYDALLQGTSLVGAQLQGASFVSAELDGMYSAGTEIWRADATGASGSPLVLDLDARPIVMLDPINGDEPAAEAGKQIEVWLADVPEGGRKDSARRQLGVLLATLDPAADRRWADSWKALRPEPRDDPLRGWLKAQHVQALRDAIIAYACDGGPDAAAAVQGMVRNRRLTPEVAKQPPNVPDVARDLLACPVAKFLDQNTLDRLAALATKARSLTNGGRAPIASTSAAAPVQ